MQPEIENSDLAQVKVRQLVARRSRSEGSSQLRTLGIYLVGLVREVPNRNLAGAEGVAEVARLHRVQLQHGDLVCITGKSQMGDSSEIERHRGRSSSESNCFARINSNHEGWGRRTRALAVVQLQRIGPFG